ncbi:MAG TPA: apolipoprotein N-acyltransferase, partial [Coxiellaceae bacterium]|nr:apolipoprotein N-acyltransferase [Coxiellaceae bacterium]
AQHLQMAQMRSLETCRAQLLDTNTGITAFISPLGEIIKGAPIGERVVITSDVQPMAGKTPLMRWRY